MDTLENLFSTDNEVVEKLKGYAFKPDYKKIFFAHLGPELRKIFDARKNKVFLTQFLEACQYEYGFFGQKIDLKKAFSLYKKYADLNDYMCMYKMHVIYLCEYEKFNVPFSRVLEKLYILKCMAYLPNYVYDWDLKLFETIDVIYEIAEILDLEDGSLEKHPLFFDLLNNQREKYNLTENDIYLMKGVFSCYFHKEEDEEPNVLSFCMLHSILPKMELDYAYYTAMNKCVYFKTYLKLENMLPDSEIEKFYKDAGSKKLYHFYIDYGNYLMDKNDCSNPKIIDLFTIAANQGYLFSSFRLFQCLIDCYDFDEIMEDYDKASTILNYLLEEIVFENVLLKQFILLTGFLIKNSKFADKIISKYLVYVKEINDHISENIRRKEVEHESISDEEEYLYVIKAYLYYFGFKGIEEQNLQKAIEFLDKGTAITKKIYIQKSNAFIKYNIQKILNEQKLLSDEKLIQSKKELIKFFSENLKLKYQIVDCYIIGEDYFEGITKKQDIFNALIIYQSAQKIFCKTVTDCFVKNKIKKFLKTHEEKIENKFKDEICCICYDRKVNKIFIPCKHNFCNICIDKLEKDSRCPMCRSEVLCIL